MIIDSHSHLYGDEFSEDIDEVLQRARAEGVGKIFLPNVNADSIEPMLRLASRFPRFLYPMMGLHPEDITDDWPRVLDEMEVRLAEPANPYIAVGEVGLDYYWDRSRYVEQQEVFARQIGWALKFGLPLMIHTRSAHREMVEVMRTVVNGKSINIVNSQSSNSKLHGVFHCFAGTAEEAEELLGFDGFMLGIGGVLTFKKSPLPEVLRSVVPLNRIVVETDSPYLAPVPHRGKRNESAFIVATVRRLAEIYEVSEAEVCEITTRNALQTFPKAG
ncbi:MAG: TatD family hydrolase [Bacteroidaceae bacterium]|nr:TatD family hydrolase [Bacteroidaceae bacterium]